MPDFRCDLGAKATTLRHPWEHTIGSGHATLALRADWQRQLHRCHEQLGIQHVRFHGLLSDDMGTLVCERDKLIHSFFNADQIFDFLLDIGMRPFIELSFMPTAIASGNTTVFHYRGNVTPPAQMRQWTDLIRKLVRHWRTRYGAGEVSRWFFEVWNEPNLSAFWTGDRDQYFEFYRHTALAIKSVDASFCVGGPATAQNAWIPEFVEFCESRKVPADFISTHYYPTDALGKTDTDTVSQLASAPPGVMRQRAEATRRSALGRPVYYTEWNITSNPRDPLHDEPFAAALAVNIAMQVSSIVDGYSYWTFSDIFEENYFPAEPFHGGFGLLNIYNIAKPAYRAFELMHRLGRELLPVAGSHSTVSAWAVRRERSVTMLLTNHAMPRHRIRAETATLHFSGGARPRAIRIERIDRDHANAYGEWIALAKPHSLNREQVARLDNASRLIPEPLAAHHVDGTTSFDVVMPPHSVAAVTMEFIGDPATAR